MATGESRWQGGSAREGATWRIQSTRSTALAGAGPGPAVDSPRATLYTPAISEAEAALPARTHNWSGHDPAYYWPDPLL